MSQILSGDLMEVTLLQRPVSCENGTSRVWLQCLHPVTFPDRIAFSTFLLISQAPISMTIETISILTVDG